MTRDQTGAPRRRVIRLWLYAVAAMVLAGGATRLTESGLSITEWQPAMGALPPLGDAQWLCEFQAALGISALLLEVPLPLGCCIRRWPWSY